MLGIKSRVLNNLMQVCVFGHNLHFLLVLDIISSSVIFAICQLKAITKTDEVQFEINL